MAVKINKQTNASIFNAMRATMSAQFQERIPALTNDNMQAVGTMLTSNEYETQFNEWQNQLVNRIGMVIFNQYLIQNPLAKYIYGEMSFGDAIEEIAVDIVKGAQMNWGQEGQSVDAWVKASNQALVEFHRINEALQYMSTIEKRRVRKAFTQEYGVQRLIGMFISALYSSANLDTWLLTKSVMAYYINDSKAASGFPLLPTQKIHTDDVVDEVTAKKFILQVRNTMSAMGFPNNSFNPQKIHKALDKRDLTLFVRADVMNTVGVEALSSAFNIEELNMNIRIEPMDDFGTDPEGNNTDDIMAVLAEDNWLLITHQFEEMSSEWNARGLYWNYFLTRQMSFGCSYFKDCVIFGKRYPQP